MRINELAIGETKTIARFNDDRVGSKLAGMGVRPGSQVRLIRKTNFDKTFYLKVDEHRFAIRASEAATIEVN